MPVDLTPDTQRQLTEPMAIRGSATRDDTAEPTAGPPGLEPEPTYEELNAPARTGGLPWAEVKAELMAQFDVKLRR